MGQLERISVGKLLYDGDEESVVHEKGTDSNIQIDDDKEKNCKTIKRNYRSISDQQCTNKKQKSEEITSVKYRNLVLLRDIASDLFENKKEGSDEEETSNNDSNSSSKEDTYSPSSEKSSTSKLKAGQHHSNKRYRTTPDQLRRLESVYLDEKMPNQELREKIAKELGMTTRRVQIWFQNKRAKEKRMKMAVDEGTPKIFHETSIPNQNNYGFMPKLSYFNNMKEDLQTYLYTHHYPIYNNHNINFSPHIIPEYSNYPHYLRQNVYNKFIS